MNRTDKAVEAVADLILPNGSRLNEVSVAAHVLKAFENKYHRNFDLTVFDGEWGNTDRYKHSHIQTLWEGWRDSWLALNAAASIPASREVGTDHFADAGKMVSDERISEHLAVNGWSAMRSLTVDEVISVLTELQGRRAASPAPQPVQEQEPVELAELPSGLIRVSDGRLDGLIESNYEESGQAEAWGIEVVRMAREIKVMRSLYASPPEQEPIEVYLAVDHTGCIHSSRDKEHISGIARQALEAAEAKVERLTEALEIIAGRRPCIDNLMGNIDIARAALVKP